MTFFLRKELFLLLLIITFMGTSLYAQNPGDILWTKYYGGDSYDEANAVIKGHDLGYIFVGGTQSFGLDRWSNAFIGKTLDNGDSLFTFHFGGEGMDILTDVKHTSDTNYIAVGFSDSEFEFEQLYLVKFNDAGDTLWTRSYGGTGKEIGFSVIEMEDKGFLIAGLTSSQGAGEEDIWILRTDMNGDTLWTKTYGTSGNDMAFGMCRTSDGNFALTGLYDYSSMMVMKINDQADTLWFKTFGGNEFDEGISIIEAHNTDLLAVGHTSSAGAGELDIYLVRLDAAGNLIYEETYGFSGYDEGRDIIQLNDDEFIIAGNSDFSSGDLDYLILSIRGDGTINWTQITGSQGSQRCYALLNNEDGNFVIAGSDIVSGINEDAALTLMFGDKQTGTNDEIPSPESFTLYPAFPNPFNPTAVIRYSIPTSEFVTLKVYDVLGNETAELVNQYQTQGTYSVNLNASEYNLSSGVYFYTLTSGRHSSTGKVMLLK